MRRSSRKTDRNQVNASLPAACAFSVAIAVSASGYTQSESDEGESNTGDLASSALAELEPGGSEAGQATDPVTRAKQIAATAPASEAAALKKTEVKELSVVMSGIELTLRANIEKALDIWQFDGELIPSVSRLRFMHRQAPEQIEAALRPFGYYRSKITESRLVHLGTKWQAVYRIKPGDLIPVGEASVEVTGPGRDEPDFQNIMAFAAENIERGQVLNQQLYATLKANIISSAAKLGYFDAEFTDQEILVDLESYTADVKLHFSTGERYTIGEITVTQDRNWLSDKFLGKYIDLEENTGYDAAEIQKVQGDLGSTAYYKSVQVRASVDDAVDKVIPVDIDLTHRNPYQYVYGVGFGTDTGARVRLGVTRRRVNKRGHHYEALAILSQIGYDVGFNYIIPTRDPRTDSYGFSFSAEREDDNRDFRNIGVGGYYGYRDGFWFKTYSLDYEIEQNNSQAITSTLLYPTVEWTWTNPVEIADRLNVFRGYSFSFLVRGGLDSVLSDTSFIQGRVSAKRVYTFGNGNRFITRGALGTTSAGDFGEIPQSLRFFSGGDTTIRGYSFNDISPEEDGDTVGGKHLAELSLEYEVPFRPNMSWAAFTDIGDAFDDDPDFRQGFGIGWRWQSPIGPIRVDVARGLDLPADGGLEFHLNIGPDI